MLLIGVFIQESIRVIHMPKFSCPNVVGHYDEEGFEVEVFPNLIVVRTRDKPPVDKKEYRNQNPPRKPDEKDDGNMSLIASGKKILGMLGNR
jgi:hypothetical protein